jgi:hypothetical protein
MFGRQGDKLEAALTCHMSADRVTSTGAVWLVWAIISFFKRAPELQ